MTNYQIFNKTNDKHKNTVYTSTKQKQQANAYFVLLLLPTNFNSSVLNWLNNFICFNATTNYNIDLVVTWKEKLYVIA